MTRTAALFAPRVDYLIKVSFVDLPVDNHQHCQFCQSLGSAVEAELYLPLEAGDGHLSKKHVECCCACVLPCIDREPHLAADQEIQVEVYRGCSLRALA